MKSEARCGDRNTVSHPSLRKDDKVSVYMPVAKPGVSSKLISFWTDPLKILDKYDNLSLKVQLGQRGKQQIIHLKKIR